MTSVAKKPIREKATCNSFLRKILLTCQIPNFFIVLQIISGGEHQMALQEVELSTSGHFVCQITMDSPPFEFVEAGGVLTVISLPERFPVISGNKGHHYGPGDRVTLNCTCYDTFPAANIRWFINGREVIYIFHKVFLSI